MDYLRTSQSRWPVPFSCFVKAPGYAHHKRRKDRLQGAVDGEKKAPFMLRQQFLMRYNCRAFDERLLTVAQSSAISPGFLLSDFNDPLVRPQGSSASLDDYQSYYPCKLSAPHVLKKGNHLDNRTLEMEPDCKDNLLHCWALGCL